MNKKHLKTITWRFLSFFGCFLALNHSAFGETDSLGAPLLFRRTGALHDEYGPIYQADSDEPVACTIEMFSHYYRLSVGMGQTLMGSPNAAKLLAFSRGSSLGELTLENSEGIYIAALPVFSSQNRQFSGRQLMSGMKVSDVTENRNYLNILTFRAGEIAEYEVRILALGENPSPVLHFKVGERPPTLRTQDTPWQKPKYYMYAKCIFTAPVS